MKEKTEKTTSKGEANGMDGSQVQIPAKVRREIEEAIKIRARASALEAEAKDLKTRANTTLLPLLSAYEIKKYTIEGLGTAYSKTASGSSVNGQKMLEQLLMAKIPVDQAKEMIENASTTWNTPYTEFKGTK